MINKANDGTQSKKLSNSEHTKINHKDVITSMAPPLRHFNLRKYLFLRGLPILVVVHSAYSLEKVSFKSSNVAVWHAQKSFNGFIETSLRHNVSIGST